jgi:hypothetical protein
MTKNKIGQIKGMKPKTFLKVFLKLMSLRKDYKRLQVKGAEHISGKSDMTQTEQKNLRNVTGKFWLPGKWLYHIVSVPVLF